VSLLSTIAYLWSTRPIGSREFCEGLPRWAVLNFEVDPDSGMSPFSLRFIAHRFSLLLVLLPVLEAASILHSLSKHPIGSMSVSF